MTTVTSAVFSPQEWLRLGAMFGVIGALHVIGWGTLIFMVAPQHLGVADKVFGVGVGPTAYALGMRHAFGLALVISVCFTAVIGPVADESSALHRYTGLISTCSRPSTSSSWSASCGCSPRCAGVS